MRHLSRNRGFTLIELMIVLVVMSILATIAIPSYQSSIRKSRRADAQAALAEMYIRQEKWRANNTTYSSTPLQIGAPSGTAKVLQYYNFTISGATATTFTVQAAAKSGSSQLDDKQAGTNCATLSINQSGTRAPAACW